MAIRPHSTVYNAKGQIAEIKDLVNNEKSVYSYDISGRLLKISQTGGKSISTGYDILNRVTAINYQFAGQTRTVTYGYGKDGQKGESTLLSGATETATYDSLGRETTSKIGDLTKSTAYTNVEGTANRTTVLPATLNYKQNNTDLLITAYTYDERGNIATMTIDSVTYTYTYDSLNQLTGVTGTNGYSASYTYDNGGNIDYKIINGDTIDYSYATDWKDRLTNYNGTPVDYDGMGNPTQNYIGTFSWVGRQLTGITKLDGTQIGYTYNSNGIRTKKTVGTVTTEYFLQGSTILAEKTGNNVIWYIYDTAGELLGFTYNGTPYYYLKNMQGDVYKIVDANGTVVGSYTYDPWGKVLTATGSMAQINPIRYRSYYYDSETQLYYLQSRYYDSELGRFINADAYISTGQGFVGNNMFAYCNNNPINHVDYSGTFLQQCFEWGKELAERFVDWLEEKADDHYSRNELNNQVSDVNEILSTYEKQNELKDAYHENTNGAQGADAKYNDKYLSPNGGHFEIIICSAPGKDPYIVDQSVDPLNMGTYNHASNDQIFFIYWIDHLVKDMVPYYMFGNTREDEEGVFKWLLK